MELKSAVNNSAYLVGVLTIVVLGAWSIVHIWTKRPDEAPFTEVHMSLGSLSGTCLVLLILTLIYKFGK